MKRSKRAGNNTDTEGFSAHTTHQMLVTPGVALLASGGLVGVYRNLLLGGYSEDKKSKQICRRTALEKILPVLFTTF